MNTNSNNSTHNSKALSTYSKLEEKRLRDLERAFIEAADVIINDPLMNVFKEKEETQQFMFERIQEIINEGMREANDKYVKEVLVKMEDMNKYNERIKNENKLLNQGNNELQKTVEELESRYNGMLETKVKEMSAEIDSYKETINMIQTESMKLEETIRRLKDDNEDLAITLRDKEKQENTAVSTIKTLEEEIERMKAGLTKNESQYLQANSKITELREQHILKEQEREQLLSKVKEMEKEMKKNDFMSKELADELDRQMTEYKEENEHLKEANEELKEMLHKNSKIVEMKNRIDDLSDEVNEKEETLEKFKAGYEEAEFQLQQLGETIKNLRAENAEMTSKLSIERKKSQSNEIELIELKDKSSELTMQNSGLSDELGKMVQDNEFLKKINQETEKSLKSERRRAAKLERELDELKFTSEALKTDNNELIAGLKNQINHLKSENRNLSLRLEKNLKDHQKKMDEERASHMLTKEKLRVLEEIEERMKIDVENLTKKVSFFKASTYGKKKSSYSGNPRHSNSSSASFTGHKHNHSYSGSSHKSPDFRHNGNQMNQISQIGQQSEFGDQCIDNKNCNLNLIETSGLKNQLQSLLFKVKNFQEIHIREKQLILNDVKLYQSAVTSLIDVLMTRIEKENKKNKYLDKDVKRLKNDLKYLQKINEEFSVKLRSQKSLSKMTTLNYSEKYDSNHSFINKPGQFTQTQPTHRPRDDSLDDCTEENNKGVMLLKSSVPGIREMKEIDNYAEKILELQKPRPSKLFEKKNSEMKSLTSSNISHCSITSHQTNTVLRPSNHGNTSNLRNYKNLEKETLEIQSRISKMREKGDQYTRERRMRDRKEYYGKENILQKSLTKKGGKVSKKTLFSMGHTTADYTRKDHSTCHYSRLTEKLMEIDRNPKERSENDRYERQIDALSDRTNNISAHLMSDTKNSEHKYGFTGIDRSFNVMTERGGMSAAGFGGGLGMGTERGSVLGDRFESHHIRFNTNENESK